ncbi:hypothetical protein WG909_04100 [Peptostreptococcaceae bacterium AGR-M142]
MKKKIILITFVCILFLIVIYGKIQSPTITTDGEPYFFINNYDCTINKENQTYLGFMFVDSKKNSKIKEILNEENNISFQGSDDIEVVKKELMEGSEYENIRIYNLILNVKFKESGEKKFNKIVLKDAKKQTHEYNIGDIKINVVEDKPNDNIRIVSHSGISKNSLNEYYCEYINQSNKNIVIDSVDIGGFEKYTDRIEYTVKDEVVSDKENIVVENDESFKINIIFNDNNDYDIYTFNPVINYRYENEKNTLKLLPFQAIYKTDFDEVQMNEFLKKYLISSI